MSKACPERVSGSLIFLEINIATIINFNSIFIEY